METSEMKTKYTKDSVGSAGIIVFLLRLQYGFCWNAKVSYETSVKCTDESYVTYTGFNITLKCQYGLQKSEIKSIAWWKVSNRDLHNPEPMSIFAYVKDSHTTSTIRGDLVNRSTYYIHDEEMELIFPLRKTDSGIYQCSVENHITDEAHIILAHIIDPPLQEDFDSQLIINTGTIDDKLKMMSQPRFEKVSFRVYVKPQPSCLTPHCIPLVLNWELKDENSPWKISKQCEVTNNMETHCDFNIQESNLISGANYSLSVCLEQHGLQKVSYNFTTVYPTIPTSDFSSKFTKGTKQAPVEIQPSHFPAWSIFIIVLLFFILGFVILISIIMIVTCHRRSYTYSQRIRRSIPLAEMTME